MIEPIDFEKWPGRLSPPLTVVSPEPYLFREKTEYGECIWDFRKLLEDASSILHHKYPTANGSAFSYTTVVFSTGNDPVELSGLVAESFWKYINICIQLSPYQLVRNPEEG